MQVSQESKFGQFLQCLRSEATRRNYSYGIAWVTGQDPNGFLNLAAADRQAAESKLLAFIVKERERVASATLVNSIKATKSFPCSCQIPDAPNACEWLSRLPDRIGLLAGPGRMKTERLIVLCLS